MAVETGFVGVPGGKIWYCRRGGGPGIPLVVVHGGPGFPHNYLLPLAELEQDRPVVFYDQLGCGRSERPSDPSLWTVSRSVEELRGVLAALGIGKAHLYGHSWGSIPAAELLLDTPELGASAVFASPALNIPRWSKDALMLRGKLSAEHRSALDRCEGERTFAAPEYRRASEAYYERFVYGTRNLPQELRDSFESSGAEVYLTMWGRNEFFIDGILKRYDRSAQLERLTLPVLYTAGRDDESTPESLGVLAALTPNAEIRIYERSAHLPHITEKVRYLEDLRRFLTAVENETWSPSGTAEESSAASGSLLRRISDVFRR